MNAKQIRKMILAILARADYDLAKSFELGQSEDPAEARRTMAAMVQIAIKHMVADAGLATLRESTRVRVTAEEKPTGDGFVIVWVARYESWGMAAAKEVSRNQTLFTHWLPLPERPAR